MDRNEKIWAYSNTGTKAHAFVQAWKDKDGKESSNYLRALCRGTIARHADATFVGKQFVVGHCTRCVTLAEEMYDRAEASMEPATETHDLGYVAMVNEVKTVDTLTDDARDRLQDEFDAAVARNQAGPCCDHATMYHGAQGCDLCECSTPRDATPAHGGLAAPAATETDPAPEFPVGTRIATKYEGVGTVVDGDRGRVKNPDHPNYGLAYVTVLFYGRGTQPRHRSRVFVASLTNLDALHAEALETDAEETAKVTPAPVEPSTPMRWRYTADLMSTDPGKPLTSRIGGYVTAPTWVAARARVRDIYRGTQTTAYVLDDLILTPLN